MAPVSQRRRNPIRPRDVPVGAAFGRPPSPGLSSPCPRKEVVPIKPRIKHPALFLISLAALALWAGICYVCYLHSPYTAAAAKRLYLRHQADFDAVAGYLLDQAGLDRFYLSNREQWPEAVSGELETLLEACGARTGAPYLEKTSLFGRTALLFHLYSGPERDSGDGGPAYDTQYLAYRPGPPPVFSNPYTEEVFPLTENWYLYNEVQF